MNEGILHRLFYATGCVFELARGAIIFAVVLALLNVFVATVNVVNGPSMGPNFQNGQYVVINKLSYLVRPPRRGEAVILKFPGDPEKTRYIKRIIGLPGETVKIEESIVSVDGKILSEAYIPKETLTQPNIEQRLERDEYFVMGDNRENSNDSRVFGPVEKRYLVGLAYFVLFPFRDAGLVPPEFYVFGHERLPLNVTPTSQASPKSIQVSP